MAVIAAMYRAVSRHDASSSDVTDPGSLSAVVGELIQHLTGFVRRHQTQIQPAFIAQRCNATPGDRRQFRLCLRRFTEFAVAEVGHFCIPRFWE